MIYIIIAFIFGGCLGFSLGALYEIKHTKEALDLAKKINDDWGRLCCQMKKDYEEIIEMYQKGTMNNETENKT